MASTPPTAKDEKPFLYVKERDAMRVLKKFKFLLDKKEEQFGRPSGKAVFSTLEELRDHLRTYGAPELAKADDKDKILIGRWIRQSILRSGDYSGGLPEGYTEFGNMRDMMNLAGFIFQNKNGLYMYPHVTHKNPNILMDGVFGNETDMILSLARNGLPDYLYDKLPTEHLLGLEVYVDTWAYEKYQRNIFVSDTSSAETTRKRTRQPNNSPDTSSESSASVTPKKLKTSPKTKPSKKPSTESKSSTPKGKSKSSTKSSFQTPEKSKRKGEEDASTPTTAATAMTTSATVDVLPWPPAMDPARTIEGSTNREVLSNVISSLKETATAPVFSEDSSLGKNLKKIQSMIHTVIRTNGRHGGTIPTGARDSKALYVCGVPGTGKTLSISWLCQYMLHLQNTGAIGVERDDDDEHVEWKFFIQNVNSVSSPSTFYGNMARKLGVKDVRKFEAQLQKTGMVLVVDEIDAMLQSNEWKRLLTKLLEYANDSDCRFILIGISNSLMDERFARIQEMGQFRDPMTFSAYSESEIKHILLHRVGSGIFDDAALKMIALKSMGDRGDARFALDMACATAENCLNKIAEDDESLSKGSLIKVKDVVSTNPAKSAEIADRIRGLPESSKLCLVVLNAAGQNQVLTARVKELRSFVAQCTENEDDILSPDTFKHCLETLRDNGLLLMESPSTRNPAQNFMESTVKLGNQLEDVQAALAKVCAGEYYERVAKVARANNDMLVPSY